MNIKFQTLRFGICVVVLGFWSRLDVGQDCFGSGMSYVALSRLGSSGLGLGLEVCGLAVGLEITS